MDYKSLTNAELLKFANAHVCAPSQPIPVELLSELMSRLRVADTRNERTIRELNAANSALREIAEIVKGMLT